MSFRWVSCRKWASPYNCRISGLQHCRIGLLTVNEIFYSIQGESTRAGRPCVFVRLTACDLRCTWCDTPYAFQEGQKRSLDDVVDVLGLVVLPPLCRVPAGKAHVVETLHVRQVVLPDRE